MSGGSAQARRTAGGGGSQRYRLEYSERVAACWDDLIGWEGRARAEGGFLTGLLRGHGVRRVLDAATGTGFHAVRLAEAGFRVVAADGSPAMVARAEANLRARGLDVPAMVADWRELAARIDGPFDAVVCLGNSFAHLFDAADRRLSLEQFRRALVPGGLLVLDRRNYDAILDGRGGAPGRHVCGTGEGAEVRLEAVGPSLVRIHCRVASGAAFAVDTYPLRTAALQALLAEAGLAAVATYGDFRADYDADAVEFLTHVARKPPEPAAGTQG